jgi:hypothetical protein
VNRLGNTDVQQILTNGIDYGIVLLPVIGVLGIIVGFLTLMGGRMLDNPKMASWGKGAIFTCAIFGVGGTIALAVIGGVLTRVMGVA